MNDMIPQDPPQRQCIKCKHFFPATGDFFYTNASYKNGLDSRCKACRYQRKSTIPKPYVCKTHGQVEPYILPYLSRGKVGTRLYRRQCPLCKRVFDQKRVQEHPNYARQWRQENPDKVEEQRKKWRKEHPDRTLELNRVGQRARRARERNARGTHTVQDIQSQYERQKGRCYYCKCTLPKQYHVDHVIPLSRGGSNDPSNLVIACRRCNESKHNKLLHEWPQGGRLF